MAAKTPAKKAAKAAQKTAKPAVGKVAVVKSASKTAVKVVKQPSAAKAPVANKVPAKPVEQPVSKAPAAAAKTVDKKAAVAKAAAAKPVPKSVSKPKAGKSVPVKASKPVTPSSKNPVPVSKSSAKTPSKTESTVKPAVSRPVGKVAVAVTSKPASPAPRNKFKVVDYQIDEVTGRPILPAGYKPAPDEEYMSLLQQEYFRQRLMQWRADLVEESKQTIENLREEVRDIGDEAERATRETENSLELRTRDRYRKLIGKIDSTLKRVDAGDYGYCVDSGEEIGLDRLEARLTAERTIDAQERWEHMQKQQGD